jgi:trehalose/maltose transport system substrate-binding protein
MARPRILLGLGLISLALVSCTSERERVTIAISGGALGQDLELTVDGTRRFMRQHPDIRVVVTPTPRTNAERLAYYLKLLEEASDEVDVLQIDVVWTGILGDHALDLQGLVPAEEVRRHFESNIRNNMVDGRLVAMPWFADFPSLYYRTDLLAKYGFSGPPQTWEELARMAATIQAGERREGNLGFTGYVWQGRAYEGLTCNALEWQDSHGGGGFVGDDGRANLSNPQAVAAFRMAAGWPGAISPKEVLDFDEEDGRQIWQRGDAAFLRGWAVIYAQTQQSSIGKSFGVAPLPAGPAGRAATLGGWQLMVSRYSRQPEAAVELVRFLTSPEEQKRRAIEGSYSPSIPALYRDPEVLKAAPLFEGFEARIDDLVVRPSARVGAAYDRISTVYSGAVHRILEGQDPAAVLPEAEAEVNAILDATQ